MLFSKFLGAVLFWMISNLKKKVIDLILTQNNI